MLQVFAGLLTVLFFASPAHAARDVTAFMGIQQDCVALGEVAFGADQRFERCAVTRARWTATIALTDMYETQYCLGGSDGACEQRVLSLFGNRAYTGTAHLLLQRVDPAGTEYDDPLVHKNAYGYFLVVSARHANGDADERYYLWRQGGWQEIDTRTWTKDLAKRLPAGVRPGPGKVFDIGAMNASVDLYNGDDATSRAGLAQIELKLVGTRLTVSKLIVTKGNR